MSVDVSILLRRPLQNALLQSIEGWFLASCRSCLGDFDNETFGPVIRDGVTIPDVLEEVCQNSCWREDAGLWHFSMNSVYATCLDTLRVRMVNFLAKSGGLILTTRISSIVMMLAGCSSSGRLSVKCWTHPYRCYHTYPNMGSLACTFSTESLCDLIHCATISINCGLLRFTCQVFNKDSLVSSGTPLYPSVFVIQDDLAFLGCCWDLVFSILPWVVFSL